MSEIDVHWIALTCRSDGAEEKISKLEYIATITIQSKMQRGKEK